MVALNFFSRETVTIAMSALKFHKGMIDLVVHNSVTISYVSTPTFQILNSEIAQKFSIYNRLRSINPRWDQPILDAISGGGITDFPKTAIKQRN